MKRTSRQIALIAVAAVALSGTLPLSPAVATVSDPMSVALSVFGSSDPQTAWFELNDEQRAAFDAATRPDHATYVETARSKLALAAFTGCWAKVGQWTQYSSINIALYNWWQTTQVCASQGVTTAVSVNNYGGQATGLGWYTTAPPTTSSFRTSTDGRGLVRTHFALGSNGWNLQEASPCGQIRLGANGSTYSSSTSCILNN